LRGLSNPLSPKAKEGRAGEQERGDQANKKGIGAVMMLTCGHLPDPIRSGELMNR
jgi:hypothetical protein